MIDEMLGMDVSGSNNTSDSNDETEETTVETHIKRSYLDELMG
jgi:hypothetical protein